MGILSGKDTINYVDFERQVRSACGYDHTGKFLSAVKGKFGSGQIKTHDLNKYIKEDMHSRRDFLGILSEDFNKIVGRL